MSSPDRGRIIDVNSNRAREGLRVMEDLARLALNDPDLARALKSVRHDLRSSIENAGLGYLERVASRDTPGDVGTAIQGAGESDRRSLRDVAIAAAGRAGEALRMLEEMLKLGGDVGARAAASVKQLRYRVYELDKRLALRLGSGTVRQWRLCVLITESLCTYHPWQTVAREALAGGADCLQLREKALDGGELLKRATELVGISRAHASNCPTSSTPASVIVNDRPDIAILAGADGVHLGQTDLPVGEVRKLAGSALIIGVSTTNMEQARRAADDGADYCGVGPMFATTTKHKPELAGAAYLKEYLDDARTQRLPHLAIGGINAANVGELVNVGGQGVAVSSAVCGADHPRKACEAILRAYSPA